MTSKSIESTQAKEVFSEEQQEKAPGQDSDTFVEKGLDELIQSLWDNEDDSDTSHKDDSDDSSDREVDKLTASSQPRRRVSHQASDTESDAEVQEEAPDEQELEEIYEFFSTQRQKNSQREKSENLSGVTEISSSDESSDEENAVGENCPNVSSGHRRQSISIVDQLQSSCSPQTQKSNTSLDQGLTASLKDDCTAPSRSRHRNCQDGDQANTLETLPCFVRMEKLANDQTTSPFKENQVAVTVSSCLENQKNLKCGGGERRVRENGRKLMDQGGQVDCGRQQSDEDCSFRKDTDATLADVRDSIFYSGDDIEEEPMDISQSSQIDIQQSTLSLCQDDAGLDGKHTEENHEDEDSTLQRRPLVRTCKVAHETESRTLASDMTSSTLSPWKPDSRAADTTTSPSKYKPRTSGLARITSSQSGTEDESVLPFVDFRSQPGSDIFRTAESAFTGNQHCQEKELVSDSPDSDDGVAGSQETSTGDVIDLSQDDDNDNDATGGKEDNTKDSDKDDSWVVPQTPPLLTSKSKSTAVSLYHKPPLKQKEAGNPVRARKFNFRRRDKVQSSDDEMASGRTEPENHSDQNTVNAISGDDFTSVTETPAPFRADTTKIRDSSTPICDLRPERVSHNHVSPIVPLIETGTDQKKDERLGHAKSPFKVAVSPRHGRAQGRAFLNDASPNLRTLTRSWEEASNSEIIDLEELETSEQTTSSQRSKSSITLGDDHGLDESRHGLSDNSDTPTCIRPTPDCFDVDTPILVRSIPAPAASPSPPPSPTFAKPNIAANLSSGQGSLEETIIDQGNTDYGSLSLRCKRKLQDKDSEGPAKRPKSRSSQSASSISANCLSPVDISDEDEDILISPEDDKNQNLGKLSFKDTAKASRMDGDTTPWSGRLCVGQSPTRESTDLVTDLEAEEVSILSSDEASQDSFTPQTQINQTRSPEHAVSFQAGHLQVSPIGQDKTSPSSESVSPEKKTTDGGSSPTSQSSLNRNYSPSTPNESEYQFAYLNEDGGGYMDDYSCFFEDRGQVLEEKSSEPEIRKPRCGGFSPLEEKPCASEARSSKYSSSLSNHGNVSIRSFPSSDEEKSLPRSSGTAASQWGASQDILSESVLLRDEAQEFGCSESFLQDLKAGHIDEDAAWGGVRLTGGGPSKQKPKNTVLEASNQVNQMPVASRKQPMSKERIDELYYPPAPITPMPPYDDMNTPLLKNELKRFGVKPLPKKKARMKLKEMYSHTHQVLEDEDSDSDKSGPITFKLPPASTKPTSATTTQKPAPKKASLPSKAPQQRGKKPAAKGKGQDSSGDVVRIPWYPDSDTDGEDPFADESNNSGSSQNNRCQDGKDEDEDEDDEEDDDFPEPSQRTAANIQESIRAFIRANSDWYKKILQYEPLDIDAFQAALKSSGIRYSMSKLRDFLDNHSLTYRNLHSRTNRHVRKPKKPKPK